MRIACAIVGGGIVGSAIAYELARRGVSDIHVLDPDLAGALSSTERNAGGVRHLWQQRINVELARHSISLFSQIGEQIGFQRTGYLWLYTPTQRQEADRLLTHTRNMGLDYTELSVADIQRRCPFIDRTENLGFGIFGAKDGLINSNALKQYFRDEAVKKGVVFHDRAVVSGVEERKGKASFSVQTLTSEDAAHQFLQNPKLLPKTKSSQWECDSLILSAGAWMSVLLSPLLGDPLVQAIRRQICLFKAEDFDMTPYGMIVDTSRVYFHPEGGNILAGFVLKDEKPDFAFNYDSDFFESHIWPALFERSSKLERLKEVTGWGGLYSYTPDTSGILGKVPGCEHIFEAHSFTGRGVMQSYGAALALAELILDGKYHTIDARGLSRERFKPGNESALLRETLHI